MSVKLARERYLQWCSTNAHVQFTPQEIQSVYTELKQYLQYRDPQLTQAEWLDIMEFFFYLCVYSSHDADAYESFQRIKDTVGINSARVKFLQVSLMQSDDGNNERSREQLKKLVDARFEYDTDMVSYVTLMKKLISMDSTTETKCADVLSLLEKFPMDPELWWFMYLQYFDKRQWGEAIYCLQEVILILPLNYIAHTKVAELLYYQYVVSKDKNNLYDSLNHSLRAVELSETYLEAWCFILKVCKELDNKPELVKLSLRKIQEISQEGHNENDRLIAKKLLTKFT